MAVDMSALPRARGWTSRLSATAADQALSSATNFATTIFAARLLGPSGLGVVAICLAVGFATTAMARALGGEPLLVLGVREHHSDGAFGIAVAVGLGVGVVVAGTGIFLGGQTGSALVALSIVLPVLALQDTARYHFFSLKSPGGALASDGAWAVAQGLAILVLVLMGTSSPASVVVVWGVGCFAGAAYAIVRVRPRLRFEIVRKWSRDSKKLGPWIAAQVFVSQFAIQLTVVGIGAVAGLRALGAVRAAQVIWGPLAMLMAVVPNFVLRDLSELTEARRFKDFRRRVMQTAAATSGIAAAYLIGLYVTRNFSLRVLFGDDFAEFGFLILPIGTVGLMQAVAVAPGIGSRALSAGRAVFVTQLAASAVGLPVILWLANTMGSKGAAWGMVLQSVVLCSTSWLLYFSALRSAERKTVDR